MPEEGRTWTLGAVVTEPFGGENLSFTVDAYRIKVTDQISPISSTTVYDNCFNFNGTSNPDVRRQQSVLRADRPQSRHGRSRAGRLALYSNLGTLKTQGVDLTFAWNRDIGPGNFALQTALSYLDYFRFQPNPDAPLSESTGTIGVTANPNPTQDTQFDYRLLTQLGLPDGTRSISA